jgi:SAM-dependent methyltransferase
MVTFAQVAPLSGLTRVRGYDRYFADLIFAGVPLAGKRVLDVGGGTGIGSFWAVMVGGAASALVLEPSMDGSPTDVHDKFHEMAAAAGTGDRVQMQPIVLEDLDPALGTFDVVLLHQSINHIGEAYVADLPYSLAGQQHYHAFFDVLAERTAPGGTLIVMDSSNRNLFGDFGRRSPLLPTVDFRMHQPPEQWSGMLAHHGFTEERITWLTRREAGVLGTTVLRNKLAAYLTTSFFVLQMRRDRG